MIKILIIIFNLVLIFFENISLCCFGLHSSTYNHVEISYNVNFFFFLQSVLTCTMIAVTEPC